MSTLFLAQSPSGSLSFEGWSQSTNAGKGYTDRGAVIADPIPADLAFRDLLGDPVIGCTGAQTFYYASLAIDTGLGAAFVNSGVAVSRSTDGGTTFPSTVVGVAKDANMHFLDKPWMSVQPGPTASPSDDVLHVTYTDFDFSGFFGSGPCPDGGRTAVEYVNSTDGGQTWSTPIMLDERCGSQGFLQGSQVEGGPNGTVYAAWERYSPDLASRNIQLRAST
ncbi:MAG TPA: sialidase family protein, partial [Micromonosporaceae bacterium]|nr:sialidase family protein [Micromonosporaceae bacterium]